MDYSVTCELSDSLDHIYQHKLRDAQDSLD